MDSFFTTMTLTSYLQRLADAQRTAALFIKNRTLTPEEFIDWIRDPIQQWLDKQDYFAEEFPRFLIREIDALIDETIIDKGSLQAIYKAYLSTVIENHTKSLRHLLTMLKNAGFRYRDDNGRCCFDATIIVDTLIHQAYEKQQLVNHWHPESVFQEFGELLGIQRGGK